MHSLYLQHSSFCSVATIYVAISTIIIAKHATHEWYQQAQCLRIRGYYSKQKSRLWLTVLPCRGMVPQIPQKVYRTTLKERYAF